jgi:hypothetical protein
MKLIFTAVGIFFFLKSFSQTEYIARPPMPRIKVIFFNYDEAGNQVKRYYRTIRRTEPIESKNTDDFPNNIDPITMKKNEEFINQIKVYPNPTDGKINISWTEEVKDLILKVEIIGYSNPFYKELKFNKEDYNIQTDISYENTGIYILKFHLSNEKSESIQIIKE